MPFINDKLEYLNAERQRREAEAAKRVQDTEIAPTEVNLRTIQTRYKFDVTEVMRRLRGKIYGQEAALKRMESMLKIVRADLTDPERPLYVGLFLGPTGVGKTEMVRVLAEAIHGNRDSFCRVDMNTLSQDHYAAALTGAPPGYVGSKEGSTVFDKEKVEGSYSRPGIVLFDEIEKAGPQVLQTLLNIFDSGRLTIASGEETIDFRNSMIFMTSNLGGKEIQSYAERNLYYLLLQFLHALRPSNWGQSEKEPLLDRLVKQKLEVAFQPEFINRIDDVITFNWLNQHVLFEIIDLLTEPINRKLERFNCRLEMDQLSKEFLVEKGFDKRYGVRAMKRAVRQYLHVPLAEILMLQPISQETVIRCKVQRASGKLQLKVAKQDAKEAAVSNL